MSGGDSNGEGEGDNNKGGDEGYGEQSMSWIS